MNDQTQFSEQGRDGCWMYYVLHRLTVASTKILLKELSLLVDSSQTAWPDPFQVGSGHARLGQRVVIELVLKPWPGHSWTCWSDHPHVEWGHPLHTDCSLTGRSTWPKLRSPTHFTQCFHPTVKMQPFSLGVTTRGVTGAERGPHLAASLQRSIVEPYGLVSQARPTSAREGRVRVSGSGLRDYIWTWTAARITCSLAAQTLFPRESLGCQTTLRVRVVTFVCGAAWAWNGTAQSSCTTRTQ